MNMVAWNVAIGRSGRSMSCRSMVAGCLATAVVAGGASAGIGDINGFVVEERRFNDFPGTTLEVTNNGLTELRFNETNFIPDGGGDFANRHVAWLSEDGVNPFAFQNGESFDFSFDMNLNAGLDSPAKEAGIYMDSLIAGEGQMIAKTNGEIAAFGGYFPFFSTNVAEDPAFGGQQYTTGTTVNFGIQYRAGSGPAAEGEEPEQVATMQYFLDGVGGDVFALGNLENGVIDGSQFGVYVQYPPDFFASPPDFGDTLFSNIVFNAVDVGGGEGLEGDFNDNGSVEQADLDLVLGNWGAATTPAGFLANTEGLTDGVDQDELDAVLSNWGSTAAPSFRGSAVPEPASVAVVAGLGLATLRRRSAA